MDWMTTYKHLSTKTLPLSLFLFYLFLLLRPLSPYSHFLSTTKRWSLSIVVHLLSVRPTLHLSQRPFSPQLTVTCTLSFTRGVSPSSRALLVELVEQRRSNSQSWSYLFGFVEPTAVDVTVSFSSFIPHRQDRPSYRSRRCTRKPTRRSSGRGRQNRRRSQCHANSNRCQQGR